MRHPFIFRMAFKKNKKNNNNEKNVTLLKQTEPAATKGGLFPLFPAFLNTLNSDLKLIFSRIMQHTSATIDLFNDEC